MKTVRLAFIIAAAAVAAFVAGWAFRAYLAPEAVIDFLNQRFFCN